MKDPDRLGVAGKAWDLGGPENQSTPDHSASLAAWAVNVPGAHPFWSWWLVHVIHLRDIPGVRPAHKHYPGAEYEIGIHAISPDEYPIDIEHGRRVGWSLLTPADFCLQIDGINDQQAAKIGGLVISAIVDGRLSPDQDYRRHWTIAVTETINHMKAGLHPES